jgi:hypothetical protein
MDFFTVEVVTWLGLIRYHVLFAIDIARRKVEILGIAVNPGVPWMEQMARNLVDATDGFLVGKRYLLLDRDPLYTQARAEASGAGECPDCWQSPGCGEGGCCRSSRKTGRSLEPLPPRDAA